MPPKPPPLDVMKELRTQLLDPLAQDWNNAYWNYQALRTRYPAADAVLDFVPYVGIANGVDDIRRSLPVGDLQGTANGAAGMAIGASTTGKYAKASVETLQELAKHAPGVAKRAAVILSAGPMGYLDHVVESQKAANARYQDMPLADMAAQLQGWGSK